MHEFDDFEQELKAALERRPAPPGLKRKIMERHQARHARRPWFAVPRWFAVPHGGLLMKVTAMLVIASVVGGGVEWRVKKAEEQRRGEEARQQVLTALRITGHALDEVQTRVQTRLAAHDRGGEE